MARDIKTRFVLEGEQKFKSAMKDSANAIKVLNSEEKLAKAQFQQTGDAQKYAAQQAEILRQKIAEQKAAVTAAEEAIRQLSENGVAENSRQMQQWKIRLNDAQTALTRMETDLASLGSESSEAAAETENLGDSLESLDKKASLEAVLSSVNKLSDGLGTALTKVKDLATGLVSELSEAASWADDLATTAVVYGMDTQTLQRMQFAAQLVDTDVETIIKSRQKLEQAMKSARPAMGTEDFEKGTQSVNAYEQAFAQLGVQIMRYGQYRDWEDVFWETGDALMHMTDGLDDVAKANAEVIRDTTAQQLFGKSWRELLPLFTAGREGYQAALDSAATVSEEDVGKLTALDDALQELKNQFDVLEKTVLASLAPTLTELSNALSGLLAQFNEYLQSEEGQKMLEGLGEAVSSLFQDITNADFSAALETVKDAMGKINGALDWIKTNRSAVVGAIEAIVGAWMALKVTSGMTTVLQLIAGLKGLGIGGGAAAAGAAGAATAGAASGAAGAAGAAAGGGGFWATLGAVAAKATPALAFLGTLFENVIKPQGNDDILTAEEEAAVKAGNVTPEIQTKIDAANPTQSYIPLVWDDNWAKDNPEVNDALGMFAESAKSTSSETAAALLRDMAERYQKAFVELEDEPIIESIYDNLSEETGNALSEMLETVADGGMVDPMAAIELIDRVKNELTEKLTSGAAEGSDLNQAMQELGIGAVDNAAGGVDAESGALYNSAQVAGENASVGLANGINARADVAIGAAQALAAAVAETISAVLKIASPSKVMMEMGSYVGQGFAEGIESQIGLVNRAAERMADSVNVNPSVGGGYGNRNGGMIDVALYLGPDQLTEIMTPLMNDAMGEEVALARR